MGVGLCARSTWRSTGASLCEGCGITLSSLKMELFPRATLPSASRTLPLYPVGCSIALLSMKPG
jgi:hypothetical protein